ncbi:YigZ family protein [Proteinivorax hydrogeniformans]|uniref:YigZ family protein n=1 Tax=Proteinivorax hydrogeniformans TaxID=1826727 RepID=A0AAU8HVW8_9FIRM
MLNSYKTINNESVAKIDIKKSKFIGAAAPAQSEEQALAFIEKICKKHQSATHNVYAYQIGQNDEIQRCNDDGEPTKTAGKPILELIRKEELKNVVVVVTRYFGGIKLGTGGLIRAYGQSAKEALVQAKIGYMQLLTNVEITFDYTAHGKIENYLNPLGVVKDTSFSDKVQMCLMLKDDEIPKVRQQLLNITSGELSFNIKEKEYIFKEDKDN